MSNSPEKWTMITGACCLLLLIALLTSCTEHPAPEEKAPGRTVVDCAGRQVRLPEKVARVVDLALLDGTRTLVQLEAAGKLVGGNDFVRDFMYGKEGDTLACWFAAPKAAPQLKDLLSVGSCREPNVELINSLNPDVILAYASNAGLADAIQAQTGLPVACIRSSGCLDYEIFRVMGKIVGKEARAEELIAYARQKVERIAGKSSQIPEARRPRVFFWGWPVLDAPKTIAPYDPIDLAGGVNVAMQGSGIKPYEAFDITKEQLAVWNPDVILLQWWTPEKIGVRIETILDDPALQTISAVKNQRVYYWRSFMKGWDPAMGVCEIYFLARLLYPDLHGQLDVEAECNEILERFYGLDGLFTDLLKNSELHRFKQAGASP